MECMHLPSPSHSVQHVYHDRGAPIARRFEGAPSVLCGPVTRIMSRTVTCAHPALAVEVISELLVRERVGCIPVVDKCGRPVGVITNRDLVEQLLVVVPVGGDSPTTASLLPRTAIELMVPDFVTVAQDATVELAATVMTRECVHHLGVVDADGRLIGVVSTTDIVRSLSASAPRPSP